MPPIPIADRVGPNASGSKVLNRIREHLDRDEWDVFAGVLKGPKYEDGTPVATILFLLEHGAGDGRIPPRPILRHVAAHYRNAWKKQFAKLLLRGMDVEKAMKLLGEIMAGDIRRVMSEATGTFEDNAKSTIRKKGFNAPFRESGHLLDNSISYEVRKGGKAGKG